MLRLPLLTAGFVLMLAAPASLYAQPDQHDRQGQGHAPQGHQSPAPGHQASGSQRPGQQHPGQGAGSQPGRPNGAGENFGNWNKSWGARPPAPPAHFTRRSDWYRHVRACQQRYRSYNPRTDTYRTWSGRTIRCTL